MLAGSLYPGLLLQVVLLPSSFKLKLASSYSLHRLQLQGKNEAQHPLLHANNRFAELPASDQVFPEGLQRKIVHLGVVTLPVTKCIPPLCYCLVERQELIARGLPAQIEGTEVGDQRGKQRCFGKQRE